jgi:hypothetical protein
MHAMEPAGQIEYDTASLQEHGRLSKLALIVARKSPRTVWLWRAV